MTLDIVLIDMDGVLADFEGRVVEGLAQRGYEPLEPSRRVSFKMGDDYPERVRSTIYEICRSPGFFRSLKPIEGAVESVHEIEAAGYHVAICTSPLTSSPTGMQEKHEWASEHLGDEYRSRIVITKDKTLVHGRWLIDDRPEVEGMHQPSWEHILFDQPYNRTDATRRRLDSWSKWRSVLREP